MVLKEKVLNAVRRKKQDYLPTQIDYTPEMEIKIIRLLGVDKSNLDYRLDNHIRYFTFDDKVKIDRQKGIQYDIWGVGWDLILTEGFHIRYHPLLDSDDIKNYNIPEPEENLIESLKSIKKEEKENFFILFDQGWTLFERGWLLRGMENFLTDFYYREKEIDYLLNGITEFHLKMAEKIIKLGIVDGIYTGDDIGSQKGLLISPDIWKKFFKKNYEKIWDLYKKNNLVIFHHSCGNLIDIIPDLIDIGLDVLTPIQPEAMDPKILCKRFGKDLSFMGGISTQKTLPYGTPKEVENEIKERIQVLGRYNGYIISPSHEITSDCKDENFLKLLEVIENYKGGKL